MKLARRCRHCDLIRSWEKGSDGIIRPSRTTGPKGFGHYPYLCGASDSGLCEVRQDETSGERMIRDLATAGSVRRSLGSAAGLKKRN